MTPKQVARELDRLERTYYKGLRALADKVRIENVIPFAVRADMDVFSAGMGSWSFHRGQRVWNDPHGLPKRLHAMLDARDIRGQDLGSQINDFRRKP